MNEMKQSGTPMPTQTPAAPSAGQPQTPVPPTNGQQPHQPTYRPQPAQQPYQPTYRPQPVQQPYQPTYRPQPVQQPYPQQPTQQPYPQQSAQQPYQQPAAPRISYQTEEPKKKSKLPLILILAGVGVAVIAAVVIGFFAFGNKGSSKADEVQTMIDELGEVTLESEAAIVAAEEAYDALETADRIDVTNENKLESARDEYDQLKEVYDAIAAIGTVEATDECYGRIDDAWDTYNDLPGSMQEKITNYEDLEAAQESYDQKKAEEVIRKIESIGTVTIKNSGTVEAARAAYDALNSDQKDLVTNKETLTAAEKKLVSLQEDQGKEKLKTLVKSYDSAEGITWYQPKAMPEFIDERSFIMPYLGQKSDKTWVRLVLNYAGVEWLNFENVTVTIDGEAYEQPFGQLTVEKGDKSGNLWETADFLAGNADLVLLESIMNSKTTVVRFEGPEKYFDLTVSTIDKQAIRQVLDAYEAVK